jgi:hypothetical protein
MKAIVLSYDKYHSIAYHMILCYQNLWPSNPFIFRIPFQNSNNIFVSQRLNINLIKTLPDIKSTVLTLIDDIDDDEIIYWCMDDRYPLYLDVNTITAIYKWFYNNEKIIDGVSYTLSAKDKSIKYSYILSYSNKGPMNTKFYKRKHYGTIWSHQFLKTKVLRYFFQNMPDNIKNAKHMDEYLLNEAILPSDFNLYVSTKSFGLFGESTSRGKITKNCYDSMINNALSVDKEIEITESKILNNIDQMARNRAVWRIKDIIRNI